MRNARFISVLTSVAAISLALPANAQQQLKLDSKESKIKFHAENTFDKFDGTAAEITGALTMNGDKPASAHVEFPSAALKTGVGGRDANMDEPRFLDIFHFPTVAFTMDALDGQPVTQATATTGKLRGSLKIRTVSLPIVASVTYIRSGDTIRVTGDFPLDIRKLGMDPPVVALVQRMDPTIQISFTLVFKPAG